MGTDGGNRPGEVDQLLAELLPRAGDEDRDIPRRRGTDASGTLVQDTNPRTRPRNKPKPGRQVNLWPLVVVSACVVIAASVGSYWLGSQRSEEVVGQAVGERASTRATTTPSTSAAEAVTTGTAPVTAGPEVASEVLRSELGRIDLSLIEFAQGTDTLTAGGLAVLSEVAAVLVAQPEIPVGVEVSTFTESTPGQNHGLSTRQAESIVQALAAEGVPPTRLAAIGSGSSGRQGRQGDSALLFDIVDPDLAEDLAGLEDGFAALDSEQTLTSEALASLDRVGAALAKHPASSLSLVAYAYAESSASSHRLSHVILDQAVAHLEGLGVDTDRLSTLGMGRTPIDRGVETDVTLVVGPRGAMSVAIDRIDTEGIVFVSGTDQLTSESLAVLDEVASAIAIDPAIQVEISVHTYTEATSQANHDLSHQQGDAVAAELIKAGAANDRLVVTGHGDPSHFASPGRETFIIFYPRG